MLWLVAMALACPPEASAFGDDPRLSEAIVVQKARRELGVYRGGALSACYRIGLGGAPVGPKRREGDQKTPEGWYRTSDKPESTFADAISIHYPNLDDAAALDAADRARVAQALASGRRPPQDTAAGSHLLIHGGGSATDWTIGCIALDDADLTALRAKLAPGMAADLLILP